MLTLSGPRLLAISTVGSLVGYALHVQQAPTLAKYKAMTHDALLADLTSQNTSDLGTSLIVGLFLIGSIAIATDFVTRLYTAIWRRIEPEAQGQSIGGPAA